MYHDPTLQVIMVMVTVTVMVIMLICSAMHLENGAQDCDRYLGVHVSNASFLQAPLHL